MDRSAQDRETPQAPATRDALRLMACGCEGSGTSTLADRLVHGAGESGAPLEGLAAGPGQGIAADAQRAFSTARRNFLVADASALDLRRVAAAASMADLAVLVVDARTGFEPSARGCIRIVSMFGVRQLLLAVNKMDAVGWNQAIFNAIVAEFSELAAEFGFVSAKAIPLSALSGDNVTSRCGQSAWYGGPTLLERLETLDAHGAERSRPFRMAVQAAGGDSAGLSGCVASGSVAAGAEILIQPGGTKAWVKSITAAQGARDAAHAGDTVTITLDREVDAGSGRVLSSVDEPVQVSDQFSASLLWVSARRLMAGRRYAIRLHAAQADATVTAVKFRLDAGLGAHLAAKSLGPGDIGEVTFQTSAALAFEPYGRSRALGAFTLIDRITGETLGGGMIKFALDRASNIPWQALDVGKAARAQMKGQRPACVWLTGLSGSGKSTIANLLEKRLHLEGCHTYLLDGDNVRHGLCRDLGFTEADRVENIRRVAETAKLMVDAGLVVIVSFISPFRTERDFARSLFAPGEFHEVFVDAPLEVCEGRDAKGLYAKARKGEIANFTGIDSPYEMPTAPEVHLDTRAHRPEECVRQLMKALA